MHCCAFRFNFDCLLHVGPSWRHLGAFRGDLGALLALVWAILGVSLAILGLSWPVLGLTWGILGPLGAAISLETSSQNGKMTMLTQCCYDVFSSSCHLEPSWGHLGRTWGHLGAILASLGVILGSLGLIPGSLVGSGEAKNIDFPLVNSGAILGYLRPSGIYGFML